MQTFFAVDMFHFTCGFLFAIVFYIHPCSLIKESQCGRPNGIAATARIVGGYNVGYYKYPWFAALISDNEICCGGTLIGSQTILTAAHCFKPYFKQLINQEERLEDIYTIKLGIYNHCRSEPSQKVFRCTKVYIHERYFDEMPYFDIALITLDGDTHEYTPVCLPDTIKKNYIRGREGTVQGLGRLDHKNEMTPCTLQEARLLIYSDDKCIAMLNSTDNDGNALKHAFCAGYLEGKIDTCLGDSGGPLLVLNENGQYMLQGITSFGFGCAQKDVLGVYTDVSHFLKWIYDRSGLDSQSVIDADYIIHSSIISTEPSTVNPHTEVLRPLVYPSNFWLYLPLRRRRRKNKMPYRQFFFAKRNKSRYTLGTYQKKKRSMHL